MSQTALVVDDSGVMRKIITRSLNALGITEIVEAGDGEQALRVFTLGRFDLVLTDWNMPKKSGIELLKAIRSQGSDVPVIMITTEASKDRVMEAIEEDVTDYLVKPFDTDALRAKLAKYVPV